MVIFLQIFVFLLDLASLDGLKETLWNALADKDVFHTKCTE